VPQISTELPATREVLKKSRRVVFNMSVSFLDSSYRLGLFCAARKIDRTRVQAKANRIEPGSAAAAETGKLDAAEIPLLYGAEDPLLRELVCSLAKVLCPPAPTEDLYAESVANLMATHVLHRYSQPRRTAPVVHQGLTRHQLRQVLDFIQANLAGDLSLAQLATVVGLSPCHFARLFSGCVGLPPHQYIIRCRVELARSLLCQRFSSLADVAVRVGFCDQSHLSRHFTRQYGLTPGEFGRWFKTRKAVL